MPEGSVLVVFEAASTRAGVGSVLVKLMLPYDAARADEVDQLEPKSPVAGQTTPKDQGAREAGIGPAMRRHGELSGS